MPAVLVTPSTAGIFSRLLHGEFSLPGIIRAESRVHSRARGPTGRGRGLVPFRLFDATGHHHHERSAEGTGFTPCRIPQHGAVGIGAHQSLHAKRNRRAGLYLLKWCGSGNLIRTGLVRIGQLELHRLGSEISERHFNGRPRKGGGRCQHDCGGRKDSHAVLHRFKPRLFHVVRDQTPAWAGHALTATILRSQPPITTSGHVGGPALKNLRN